MRASPEALNARYLLSFIPTSSIPFHSQDRYEQLLNIPDSPINGFECCIVTIQEMESSNALGFLDKRSRAGNIGYIHFRSVKGKVLNYWEVFVDEGEIDMAAIRILKRSNFNVTLIPDQ